MSRNVTLDKDKEESKPTSSLRSDGGVAASVTPIRPDPEEPSLQAAIFEVALPVLTAGGCSDKSARSLLGKLRKAIGDLDAIVVVEAMARESPVDAASWLSAAIKSRESSAIGLDEFMDRCRANGEKVVSDYEPMIAYAKASKIPPEFLGIAWHEFKRRHLKGGTWENVKREDWRRSFCIAVERNEMRLWYFDQASQSYCLTTAGVQADMATREAA